MEDENKGGLIGRAFGRQIGKTIEDDEAIRKLLRSGYKEITRKGSNVRSFIKTEKSEADLRLFKEIFEEFNKMEKTGRSVDDAINASIAIFHKKKDKLKVLIAQEHTKLVAESVNKVIDTWS